MPLDPACIHHYSVKIQPVGENAIHETFTESLEFVATKLDEMKQYNVTVSGLTHDDSVVGEDHTSIPLPTMSEALPVPSEVNVEWDVDVRHLRVSWNVRKPCIKLSAV